MRLDLYLVERLGISSRQKAQALIMKGNVFIETKAITKSGYQLKEKDYPLVNIKKESPYVGFGAYKLLKAVDTFCLNLKSKIILDIGSSTGGFTQVALEKGARIVYAIDVGTNQLDFTLRSHPQVIVYEQTNARILNQSYFTQGNPNFFTVDVSFISLSLIFPVLQNLNIKEGIVLIKPQFEVGKDIKNFKGYVKKEEDIKLAIHKVTQYAKECLYQIKEITQSPVQDKDKNQEYLAWVKKEDKGNQEYI